MTADTVRVRLAADMARTSGYDLADRVLDGQLGDLLIDWADSDPRVSYFDMALRLRDEHDLHVSPSTLVRWLKLAREARSAASA